MRLLLRSHLSSKFRWQPVNQLISKNVSTISLAAYKSNSQPTANIKGFSDLFATQQRFYSNPSLERKIPDDEILGQSIYSGKYTSRIIRVKLFSLATSMMCLYAQPILYTQGQVVGGAGLGVLICSIVGIFTFVTPVLLHFVTKKYVVDVKYNKNTDVYTAITVSFFLFRKKVLEIFVLFNYC